jgi:amino acid transporter
MAAIPARVISRPATQLHTGAVGVWDIFFFVLSAQAPLTGMAGSAALMIAFGNGAGAPGAFLIVGAIIAIFAVGYIAMSRRIGAGGGFYTYIALSLGARVGRSASWVALLSYHAIQAAMYALLGVSVSGLVASVAPLDVPWWVFSALAIVAVYLFGSRNIRLGARVLMVLVIAEIAILLALAIGVLFTGGADGVDVAASFSPEAVFAGAPGIAIMFAIASMFGFESTAIYAGEARDPQRTIPRATYLSVAAIALFFAFVMWMVVTYYGADNVLDAAGEALAGDATSFVIDPISAMLGPWAGTVTSILLCTSLFAGALAFHNMINRYFHSMARGGDLPGSLAHTNRYRAPNRAGLVQSICVAVIMMPFVLLGLDPILTLFGWYAGLAVAGIVLLYIVTSLAIVVYFRRHREDSRPWNTLIAPALSIVLMLGALGIILANFTSLIGGDVVTATALLLLIPAAAIVGLFLHFRRSTAPAQAS